MPRQDPSAAAASADLSANIVIPGPQGSTVLKKHPAQPQRQRGAADGAAPQYQDRIFEFSRS